MPRDPVCGMTVSETTALRMQHSGAAYYFCSEHCLNKFQAEPLLYAQPRPTVTPQERQGAQEYTCPMHPEVRQQEPGTCPE